MVQTLIPAGPQPSPTEPRIPLSIRYQGYVRSGPPRSIDAPRGYAALKQLDAYLGGLQAGGGFDYPMRGALLAACRDFQRVGLVVIGRQVDVGPSSEELLRRTTRPPVATWRALDIRLGQWAILAQVRRTSRYLADDLRHYEQSEAATPPTPEAIAEYQKFSEELVKAGGGTRGWLPLPELAEQADLAHFGSMKSVLVDGLPMSSCRSPAVVCPPSARFRRTQLFA
jgi:hypothetical protein